MPTLQYPIQKIIQRHIGSRSFQHQQKMQYPKSDRNEPISNGWFAIAPWVVYPKEGREADFDDVVSFKYPERTFDLGERGTAPGVLTLLHTKKRITWRDARNAVQIPSDAARGSYAFSMVRCLGDVLSDKAYDWVRGMMLADQARYPVVTRDADGSRKAFHVPEDYGNGLRRIMNANAPSTYATPIIKGDKRTREDEY